MLVTIPSMDKVENKVLGSLSGIKQVISKAYRPKLIDHLQWAQVAHIHEVWSPLNIPVAEQYRKMGKPYFVLLNGILDPWTLRQKIITKKLSLKYRYGEILNGDAALHLGNRDEERLIQSLNLTAPRVTIPNGVFPGEIAPPHSIEPFYEHFSFLRGNPFMLFMSRLH